MRGTLSEALIDEAELDPAFACLLLQYLPSLAGQITGVSSASLLGKSLREVLWSGVSEAVNSGARPSCVARQLMWVASSGDKKNRNSGESRTMISLCVRSGFRDVASSKTIVTSQLCGHHPTTSA